MSKGSITDQMGAMAVVDELRHRRLEIEQHLDINTRRAEVAERIRAYYDSQGIKCDDVLIEEGVRAYFKQRLVFQPPTMTYLEQRLGLYIARPWRTLFELAWVVFMVVYIEARRPEAPAPQQVSPPAAMTASLSNDSGHPRP